MSVQLATITGIRIVTRSRSSAILAVVNLLFTSMTKTRSVTNTSPLLTIRTRQICRNGTLANNPCVMIKVLIACECSQVECSAFRAVGCAAYSCDIQNAYGSLPQFHIKGDAREVYLSDKWDLVIAHPPCTYLSAAGGKSMYPTAGRIDTERYQLMLEGRELFMWFWHTVTCPLCIENPRPLRCANLPPRSQVVCPSDFGSPYTKRTYLWLRDLPPLLPTHYHDGHIGSWLSHCSSSKNRRSKAFEGLAAAMAQQWGTLNYL